MRGSIARCPKSAFYSRAKSGGAPGFEIDAGVETAERSLSAIPPIGIALETSRGRGTPADSAACQWRLNRTRWTLVGQHTNIGRPQVRRQRPHKKGRAPGSTHQPAASPQDLQIGLRSWCQLDHVLLEGLASG